MALLDGCRILVVEDEALVAMVVEEVLADAGATVAGSASVTGAMEILADGPRVDAAVLDINLLGETSEPVAAELSSRGVPYLFATGYSNGVGTGAAPVLKKPFLPDDLVEAVVALCR